MVPGRLRDHFQERFGVGEIKNGPKIDVFEVDNVDFDGDPGRKVSGTRGRLLVIRIDLAAPKDHQFPGHGRFEG
jgi:hypothetical protein